MGFIRQYMLSTNIKNRLFYFIHNFHQTFSITIANNHEQPKSTANNEKDFKAIHHY